jgi:CRISPR-associated protein Csy1
VGEIQSFLEKRKEDWLRTRLKPNQSEEEQQALREEADTKFSLAVWLPDAAKRAGWLSLTTHPSKFSHPSAKTSMIMADAPYDPDGFLRSGNVVVETDVLGNAAALDVYKFLSLELSDGQTVLEHVKQGTP